MGNRQSADEIEAAAVRWAWRMEGEDVSPQLESQLQAWLAEDSRRQGAFLQAQAALSVVASAGDDRIQTNKPVRRRTAFAIAAGMAVAAVLAGLTLMTMQSDRYNTSVGEIRQVPLSDGSTATINTHSALSFSLERERRLVELKRGEAWFRVARDAQRPFIVKAGRVRVRAVGTAFSVRRQERGADVLVTEGRVQTWVDGAEGHTVMIEAGAKAFVAENAAISEQTAASGQIDRSLAWRSGKIDLAGETLENAAAEFNRYNIRKLTIAGDRLKQQRLYGVFRTDDPEGFAVSVGRSLGAGVSFPDEREIRLKK